MPSGPMTGSAATGPVAACDFTVTIGDREVAVARLSAASLAADPDTVIATPVPPPRGPRPRPLGPPRVTWSGQAATGSLVLGRALDGDTTFYRWRREALAEEDEVRTAATRDVTIRVLDAATGRPATVLRLHCAWPRRWSGPVLDGRSDEVAWEELEVVYHDLFRA
jgi:phage tail-like protein